MIESMALLTFVAQMAAFLGSLGLTLFFRGVEGPLVRPFAALFATLAVLMAWGCVGSVLMAVGTPLSPAWAVVPYSGVAGGCGVLLLRLHRDVRSREES